MYNPGDVLLYSAPACKLSNVVSKLIRLITGNEVTHVALYLGEVQGKHIILDALFDGVYIKGFSDLKTREDGFVLHKIAHLKMKQHNSSAEYIRAAQRYNNKPYGILTIINLLLQHGYGRLFNTPWKLWFHSSEGYICSEVCQRVVEDVEDIKFPKLASLTEPDDYLKEPWILTPAE